MGVLIAECRLASFAAWPAESSELDGMKISSDAKMPGILANSGHLVGPKIVLEDDR